MQPEPCMENIVPLLVSAECAGSPLLVHVQLHTHSTHVIHKCKAHVDEWGLMESMAQGNGCISGLNSPIDLSSKADNWCLLHRRAFFSPGNVKSAVRVAYDRWSYPLLSSPALTNNNALTSICSGQPLCAVHHLFCRLFTHCHILAAWLI